MTLTYQDLANIAEFVGPHAHDLASRRLRAQQAREHLEQLSASMLFGYRHIFRPDDLEFIRPGTGRERMP